MATHELRLRLVFKEAAGFEPATLIARIEQLLGAVEVELENHRRELHVSELSEAEWNAIAPPPEDDQH